MIPTRQHLSEPRESAMQTTSIRPTTNNNDQNQEPRAASLSKILLRPKTKALPSQTTTDLQLLVLLQSNLDKMCTTTSMQYICRHETVNTTRCAHNPESSKKLPTQCPKKHEKKSDGCDKLCDKCFREKVRKTAEYESVMGNDYKPSW